MPAIAVSGSSTASGLARNTSRVSVLQVTPYFFRFSLGPRRLLTVPALRPTTPNRLGPTIVAELSSLATPWQVLQVDMNSASPLAASPLAASLLGASPLAASPITSAEIHADVASRAVSASRRMGRIADM